ncbi:hypothetical protein G6F43_009681 [Rhizopus delemar]|nr:hypothetical protein G6F43_009681 [Rhizopus delemar]
MLFLQTAILTLFSSSVLAMFAGQNDPRIEKWNRMKIALPDGILPEQEESLAPAKIIHRPTYRQRIQKEQPGYKHLGLPRVLNQVAPLPPSFVQSAINQKQASQSVSWQAAPTAKPYYKFVALDEKVPVMNKSIKEKQVVGLDSQGNMQVVDVPEYHRN